MDSTPPERGDGDGGGDRDRYEILLISINQRFWLVRGVKHIDTMLSGSGAFPTPVGCMVFRTHAQMKEFLPEGFDLSRCWQINGWIIARLRENDQIVEHFPEG